MKKDKKKYVKPVLKKNDPLVNITFASVGGGPGTFTGGGVATGPGSPT